MNPLQTPENDGRQPMAARPDALVRRLSRRWWLLVVVMLAFGGATSARAQDAELEYKLKAAFLFNFLKFTEWPTNKYVPPSPSVVVGCLAEDPAAAALARALEGKSVNGQPIKLVTFQESDDLRQVICCSSAARAVRRWRRRWSG